MIVSKPVPAWARARIRHLKEDVEIQKAITNKIIKRKKELNRAVIDIEKVLLTNEGSSEEKIKEIEEIINKIKRVENHKIKVMIEVDLVCGAV